MEFVAISAAVSCVLGIRYFLITGPAPTTLYKLLGINKPPITVSGYTDPKYTEVMEEFRNSFEIGNDLGASFTAYVDGKVVVDIQGGFTDTTYKKTYDSNTLQLVFSSSKFVTSYVMLYLISKGRIQIDDPVSKHWPEFGFGYKKDVTIRQLLMHRSGVAFLDKDRVPTPADILDFEKLGSKIAGQPHNFDGKEVSAYQAVTRGWYLNQLIKRITGKTIREIMYTEIAPLLNSLNIDKSEPAKKFEFHYGIPENDVDNVKGRLSKLDGFPFLYKMFLIFCPVFILKLFNLDPFPRNIIEAYFDVNSYTNKSLLSSGPDFSGNREKEFPFMYNDETLLKGESPSFGCLTNSHSLAALAQSVMEEKVFTKEAFELGTRRNAAMYDVVLKKDLKVTDNGWGYWADGFSEESGKGIEWFGWAGAGGSIVFFAPEAKIALSFVMNYCHLQSVGDKRSWRLIRKLVQIANRRS